MTKYTPHRREWLEGLTPRQAAGVLLVILWAAVLLVVFCAPGNADPGKADGPDTCLPEQAVQRCAAKALRGDYGQLAPWQAKGYAIAISGRLTRKLAWLTTYYPQEGFARGQGCRWGIGTSERVAAANRLPARTYLWISNPPHLRQVWDTGAAFNDRIADRRGADLWVDLWVPHPGWKGLDTRVCEVVVMRAEGAK